MKKVLFLCLAPFLLLASCSRQAVSSESQEQKSSSVTSTISVSSSSSSSASEITSSSSEESSLSISEHEHTFKNTWSHNSTQHWHASTCGHDVKADLANHSYKTSTTPATFDSEGYTTYTCSICGYSYKKTTGSKKQHTYATTWSNDANYHWHACIDSGYTTLKQDNAAHTFRDVVTQPTGQSGGYTTRTCTVCGYSYQTNRTPALTYTVTWLNDDRSVLEVDRNVKAGETPVYNGATPTKTDPEDHYYYTFEGWGKEITKVTGDCEYVAVYYKYYSHYFVQYLDEDDSVLCKISTDNESEAFQYLETKPQKEATSDYTYSFLRWNKISDDDNGTITYKAKYDVCTKGLQFSGDTVTGYTGSAKDVIIPEKWNGYEIKTIAQQAFINHTDLESLVIPDTVTSIGSDALFGCASLNKLTIPFVGGSPTENRYLGYLFGATVFYDSKNYTPFWLKTVIVSDACTSLDDYAFCSCPHLQYLSLPFVGKSPTANERKFNDIFGGTSYAKDAPDLREVTIRGYSIPDYAFGTYLNNYGKIERIYFGDAVTSVGKSVIPVTKDSYGSIYEPYTIKSLYEHDNGLYLGKWLIAAKYESITSCAVSDSCKGIAGDAFSRCSLLKFVTNAENVSYIGDNAFYGCSVLTSISISNKTTYIGENAFCGCGLTSFELPENIEYIGQSAFYSQSLKTVNYRGTLNKWLAITGKQNLSGDVHLFLDNSNVETTSISLPNNYTQIGDYAFWNCSFLTNFTFPNTLTSIGTLAFYKCSGLTSISVPSSVTSIGQGAFENCSSLQSITVPFVKGYFGGLFFQYDNYEGISGDSLAYKYNGEVPESLKKVTILGGTSISNLAFARCYNITSITLPSTLSSIGERAFESCVALTSLYIPSSVNSIGKNAFRYCTHLTSLSIKMSYGKKLSDYFGGDQSTLTSVTVLSGTTTIGESAFSGCSSLASVTIPKTVTSIYEDAFIGCSSLQSITIPSSVSSISDYTFYNCTSLTSITIPNSITSIGKDAFYGCSSLSTIIYNGTEERWNDITIGSGNTCLTNANIMTAHSSSGGSSEAQVVINSAALELTQSSYDQYKENNERYVSVDGLDIILDPDSVGTVMKPTSPYNASLVGVECMQFKKGNLVGFITADKLASCSSVIVEMYVIGYSTEDKDYLPTIRIGDSETLIHPNETNNGTVICVGEDMGIADGDKTIYKYTLTYDVSSLSNEKLSFITASRTVNYISFIGINMDAN